jgi:parvulin-like peptidyl-prolyl isomerase
MIMRLIPERLVGRAGRGGVRRIQAIAVVCLLIGFLLVPACAQREAEPASVRDHWQQQKAAESESAESAPARSRQSKPDPDRSDEQHAGRGTEPRGAAAATGPSGGAASSEHGAVEPIATVGGQVISRERVVDLLLRGHGPGILEQLIVLEAAEQEADRLGIRITTADVDREYEQTLKQLLDPLADVSQGMLDREEAERVLDAVLAERNISRAEYRLGIRRQTLLRAIVTAELEATDEQLKRAYDQHYGPQVQVRHIQVATPAQVAEVQSALRQGEDFAELARTHSAHLASASQGGLLEPFTHTDQRVPAALRELAFQLEPDEVSNPLRLGRWYHLVRLERRLAAESPPLDRVREQLAQRVRDALAPAAMQDRYRQLLRESEVRIFDPALREAFERRRDRSR